MKHFYKPGGDWKTECGIEYTVKAVDFRDFARYRATKWFESLGDLIEYVNSNDDQDDYESELRERIKELGGKPAGRSSVETLQKQLAELEAEQDGSDYN